MISTQMKPLLVLFGGVLFGSALSVFAAGPELRWSWCLTRGCRNPNRSRTIALKREVPTNQIFGFESPTGEDMSRRISRFCFSCPWPRQRRPTTSGHFKTKLVPATNQQPQRLIWKIDESKIRYAALCYGVPIRITTNPNLQEQGNEKLRPEMRRNEAAVDSELALLPLIK